MVLTEIGMGKKLKAIAKNKQCERVKRGLSMIRNQINWIAASSKSEPERVAKWNSIINHLQDIDIYEIAFNSSASMSQGYQRIRRNG